MQIKTQRILQHLDVDWREWEPYSCMVDDGEVPESAMVEANDAIVNAIIDESHSGRPFAQSYRRLRAELDKHGHLGFADSEGSWLLRKICREVWGHEACAWLGDGIG